MGLMEGLRSTISTHAPVKERRRGVQELRLVAWISTHAPVKERPESRVMVLAHREISTHAPVKERHNILAIIPAKMRKFQLTLL